MKTLRQLLTAVAMFALPAVLLAQDAEIWVSLPDNPNRETNGIYGFPANDPQAISPRKTAPELYFQKGMGYQDGVIYGMDYRQGFFSPDRYILYGIDTKTWTVTQRDVDKRLALKESACGADGSVYALFEDGLIGKLDYKSLVRTDIYKPSRNYVALGVNGIGELFGIDNGGQLVRISTTDGAETVVGKLDIDINAYASATGEIDPATNTFYLAAKSGWGGGYGIYAIDLTTVKGTLMGQLPAGFDYLGGMAIAGEPAAAGAPAKATNLKAVFEGNSLSGTLSFTAPTETFDHQPLEGELGYTVDYGTDGQQHLTGTAQSGADVLLPVTLTEGGNIAFSVKFANAAGEGQTASVSLWVGPDAPLAPANVQLVIDADGHATLSWTAPAACVNGGFLGRLTYDVWRSISGEEVLVAKGISETTFSEQLEITTLKEYVYCVVASNEGTLSERVTSNRVVAGDGFGVPFVEQFGEGNHLSYFTVINVNNDEDRWGELTWKLHKQMNYWGEGESYEEMWVQTDGATDDWLITPPIQLLPNNAYVLKFRMKAGDENKPEAFEVRMGRGSTVAAMTMSLLGERAIQNTEYAQFVREFSVAEAGSYCFGFHATPNHGAALYLDDIEIRLIASPDAPDAARLSQVTADAEGLLKATVSFVTPVVTIGQAPLESLTKVEVLRDEHVIATIDSPAVGTDYEVVDESPANGYHTYAVLAYNEAGRGKLAQLDSVYVGVDVPVAPVVSRMVDHVNSLHIEWNEVPGVGQNGYCVRPAEVTYQVFAVNAAGEKTALLYEGTGRSIDVSYENTDDFDLVKWIIVAVNAAGTSADGVVKFATGYPLTLPYRDTFAMGSPKVSYWVEQSGPRSWKASTEDAVGEDAGSLLFVPYSDGDNCSYNTQRLTFAGVKQPLLSFWHKLYGGVLQVKAWLPDGSEVALYTQQSAISEAPKWLAAQADLTLLKSQPYVVVKFLGTGDAGKRMFVDDILICDGAFVDGISTAVSEQGTEPAAVFDLQGRRVAQIVKGLYIYNGKKLIK